MKMKKQSRGFALGKKRYSFKIAGCQTQIKRPIDPAKNDDAWLKTFYLN